MALLQSSDFDIYAAAWSAPVQDGIQVFTGSGDLVLSTGVIQLVFDRVSTALGCTHYMETKLYSITEWRYYNNRCKIKVTSS